MGKRKIFGLVFFTTLFSLQRDALGVPLVFPAVAALGSYVAWKILRSQPPVDMVLAHKLYGDPKQITEYVKDSGIMPQKSLRACAFVDKEPSVALFRGTLLDRTSDLGQKRDMSVLDDTITRQHRPGHKTKLFGVSRGAATALAWSGDSVSRKEAVSTIIAESPFPSVSRLIYYHNVQRAKEVQSNQGFWRFAALVASAVTALGSADILLTYRNHEINGPSPVENIQKGIHPTLIVMHKHDHLCPEELGIMIYESARAAGRENVHIVTLDDNKHEGALNTKFGQCAVNAFWKKYDDSYDSSIATPECEAWFEKVSRPPLKRSNEGEGYPPLSAA